MSLQDTILSSIEAEIEVLKSTQDQAPVAPSPVAATPSPAPAPVVEDESNLPPVIRFAREEARRLQGK